MKTTSGQRSSSKDNGLRDLFERLDEHVPYVQDNLDPILDSGEKLIFSDVRHDPRAPETLRQIWSCSILNCQIWKVLLWRSRSNPCETRHGSFFFPCIMMFSLKNEEQKQVVMRSWERNLVGVYASITECSGKSIKRRSR